MIFTEAKRESRVPKILLVGPAGAGKTKSALYLMQGIIGDAPIALIDTEFNSSTIYANEFKFLHSNLPLADQHINGYITAMKAAYDAKVGGLIIDSISPAWEALIATSNTMQGNSFTNWAKLTPLQKTFAQKIVSFPIPLICTARSKQSYVLEANAQGKMVPKKVGMETVQGKDLDYEFDIVFAIDQATHNARIDKCRYSEIEDYFTQNSGEVRLTPEIGKLIAKITKG